MSFFRYIVILFFMVSSICVAGNNNYYHSFRNPLFQGYRLDYCMGEQEKTCGLAVANRYCELMGYEKSVQQSIDYNVGKTQAFSCGISCKGWTCNGFKVIRCMATFKRKPASHYYYRERKFVYPRFDHKRVAWCYENGTGCGAKAANSFCRRMGYSRAKAYKKQPHVSETSAISNHQVCVGTRCNAYESITCYR